MSPPTELRTSRHLIGYNVGHHYTQAYTRNTIRHALSYKQLKVKTNQTIVFMRKFHYCFHLIKFTNSIG